MAKRIYLTAVFSLLAAGLFTTQYFFDQNKKRQIPIEPIVLSSEIIKIVDLGLHNAAADFAWLSAIQYFGGPSKSNYEKIDDYLYLASDLDPKFAYPYAFSSIVLPSVNQTDKAIELAKKGIAEATPDWRIPYFLATTYHIDKEDSKNASYYFDLAAHTKGAPEGARKVAATYGSRPDIRDQTKQIWLGIYESSNDEIVKERAKNYIIHFEILSFLEEAARQYKKQFQKFPVTPEEMIPSILKNVPNDPLGLQIKFDENGRAVIK